MKAIILLCLLAAAMAGADNGEWPAYGRDPGGQRYSPLKEINRSNVSYLKIAWTFRTGDAYRPKRSKPTAFETTPLYVDGTLYLGTPLGRVIALDPLSGKQKWAFDSHIDKDLGFGDYSHRGVSTWKPKNGRRRIYIATIDARLIALDAATGAPCSDFGDNGTINLREGLRIPVRSDRLSDYEETSPPAVIGDTLVVGSAVADNVSATQPSGEVRAFDTTTGKLKWKWDPMADYPKTGAGNAWAMIAADPARNLVFVPTGSPSPDYYGGERLGDDLYANSVVALRADTGERVWYFQTVHHDLWDYDVATPPMLFEMKRDGVKIPAIAIGSKTGNVFILNRETGKPVFGVEERPVPKSDVPGEVAAVTQPFPVKPNPITAQTISVDEAWGMDDGDRDWCRAEMSKLRMGTIFTPPSIQGSLFLPGNVGGMNWGGFAYDAAHEQLILSSNHLAAEVRLIPRAEFNDREAEGRRLNGDWEFAHQSGTPYGMMRRILLSPKRVPCTAPPWGTLIAISASTGEKKWEVPLGQFYAKLPEKWGSASLGGPIATAGGLVFIAGTLDPSVYAFDTETGKQLWRGKLPTSARATPMTYRGPDGKQYLLLCAGGHQPAGEQPLADYVIAFSL